MEEGGELGVIVGEVPDGVVELPAEAPDHIGDDGVIGLLEAAVIERVGEAFEGCAVLLDGEMALEKTMEFLERLRALLVAVREEESTNSRDEHVHRGVIDANGADDVL